MERYAESANWVGNGQAIQPQTPHVHIALEALEQQADALRSSVAALCGRLERAGVLSEGALAKAKEADRQEIEAQVSCRMHGRIKDATVWLRDLTREVEAVQVAMQI